MCAPVQGRPSPATLSPMQDPLFLMSPPALPPLLSLPFPQATGPDTVSYYAPPPGAYAIDVFGFGDETDFELEAVLAPAAPPLHKEDAAVLEKVAAACCPAGDAAACPVLRSALAAAAGGGKEAEGAAASDLCSRPPNACDADGRLTRLALAGEGLACRFPADLGRLPRLTALDLTANALHGDWASDVGPVLRALAPRLEAAHLSLNKLEGRLTCDLVGGEGEEGRPSRGGLRILALTGNRASGTLPACLFAGPVRELYAARNELGGSLPPIPADQPCPIPTHHKRHKPGRLATVQARVRHLPAHPGFAAVIELARPTRGPGGVGGVGVVGPGAAQRQPPKIVGPAGEDRLQWERMVARGGRSRQRALLPVHGRSAVQEDVGVRPPPGLGCGLGDGALRAGTAIIVGTRILDVHLDEHGMPLATDGDVRVERVRQARASLQKRDTRRKG